MKDDGGEAQVLLEELLYNESRTQSQPPWFLVHKNDSVAEHWSNVAGRILNLLKELGYRKLPQNEPPLIDLGIALSDRCGLGFPSDYWDGITEDDWEELLKAQRDGDIKWYQGGE